MVLYSTKYLMWKTLTNQDKLIVGFMIGKTSKEKGTQLEMIDEHCKCKTFALFSQKFWFAVLHIAIGSSRGY